MCFFSNINNYKLHKAKWFNLKNIITYSKKKKKQKPWNRTHHLHETLKQIKWINRNRNWNGGCLWLSKDRLNKETENVFCDDEIFNILSEIVVK